jgi:hypothetical protein
MTFIRFIMATRIFYSFKRILFVCLFLGVTKSYAQEYGVIPANVRSLMDANKLNGLPTYTGVVTSYLVHCTGIENNELPELQERALQLPKIKSLNIQSNESIEVVCAGGTGFSEVKGIFSSLVTEISNISIENRIE